MFFTGFGNELLKLAQDDVPDPPTLSEAAKTHKKQLRKFEEKSPETRRRWAEAGWKPDQIEREEVRGTKGQKNILSGIPGIGGRKGGTRRTLRGLGYDDPQTKIDESGTLVGKDDKPLRKHEIYKSSPKYTAGGVKRKKGETLPARHEPASASASALTKRQRADLTSRARKGVGKAYTKGRRIWDLGPKKHPFDVEAKRFYEQRKEKGKAQIIPGPKPKKKRMGGGLESPRVDVSPRGGPGMATRAGPPKPTTASAAFAQAARASRAATQKAQAKGKQPSQRQRERQLLRKSRQLAGSAWQSGQKAKAMTPAEMKKNLVKTPAALQQRVTFGKMTVKKTKPRRKLMKPTTRTVKAISGLIRVSRSIQCARPAPPPLPQSPRPDADGSFVL